MAPALSQAAISTTTSVIMALLGLFFFTRKVAKARVMGGQSSSPTTGSSRNHDEKIAAFAVGLLDIAIPRDDRAEGSFSRVMINDACITRAVQEVSRKLVISLRDSESMPSGRVRAYVSNLYQEIYDAACAARRPHLDIRVLLPQEAASGRCETGGIRTDSSLLMPTAVSSSRSSGALSAVGCGWVTRDLAELEPDLQVLLTDEPQEHHFASLNAERVRVGFSALNTISLQEVARRAYKPEYFYAEDVTADIPNFTNVACGGTFDRLHGGHKKLLTFAASMCPEGTLTVGVTSNAMLKAKSNAHMLSSLQERLEGVREFLRGLNPHMQLRVEEINNPFGPPVVEEAFDAIVVSSETIAGAEKINEIRAQKGFRPLAVAVTRRLSAATLSSTFLRNNAEAEDNPARFTEHAT